MSEQVQVPDFSRKEVPEPKRFTIDGFTYECSGVLPAGATRDLAKLSRIANTANIADMVETLGAFMDSVMYPTSAKEFAERIRDPLHPIDDSQIGDIVMWLIREYGDRPTNPPSPSSAGRTETGTSSTDGV